MPPSSGRRANEASITGRPRERVKAHIKATRPPFCEICGYPINMDADPHRDPLAPAVDERTPRSRGGSALDPANLALVHRWCNGSKSNRTLTAQVVARCRQHIAKLIGSPTIRPW